MSVRVSDLGQAPAARAPSVDFFPVVGGPPNPAFVPQGPGLVLMGGKTDVDQAFVWMHKTLMGSRSGRGGDVVVLTAASDNFRDPYIASLAPFNSVRTVRVPPGASPAEVAEAARVLGTAHAVFMSGGDQSRYVQWKGTPIQQAIQRVYDQGGVVGGTSAGLAVLGDYVFDARRASVTSEEALKDPLSPDITFTEDLFEFPPLEGTITDTHFAERGREGRLAVFMARLLEKTGRDSIQGVGVDEGAALVVDGKGRGTLLKQPGATGGVHLSRLRPEDIRPLEPGRPLQASVRTWDVFDSGTEVDLRTLGSPADHFEAEER
jgi:cyanophycinase